MRFLNTSRGHTPLMGLKPLREPPTKCRGRVEMSTPGAGATDSPLSGFSSFGLGWKGRKGADMGESSGVRGMLTGRMAGWTGCRGEEREEEQIQFDLHNSP